MLIKLAVLGALGYAGYRYLQGQSATARAATAAPSIPLAGGPLSTQARVQHSADEPPATSAYTPISPV